MKETRKITLSIETWQKLATWFYETGTVPEKTIENLVSEKWDKRDVKYGGKANESSTNS